MATEPLARRIAWGQWLLFLLIVGLIGGAYAWWVNQPREPDMTEIYRANLKGIGLLDYFDYPGAVQIFDEIHEKAPKWIPGRVNLGDLDIVLLRIGGTPSDALAGLNHARPNEESAPVVFLNTGESLPRSESQKTSNIPEKFGLAGSIPRVAFHVL